MINFLKKIVFILYNLNKIYDSLILYNDKSVQKAINFYKERINDMSELFKQDPFNYEKKINTIASISATLNNFKNRNDYELIKKGYNIEKILEVYKHEQLMVIMNLISYTNPLYNMNIEVIDSEKIKLVFDSPIVANKFIEILDYVYNNAIEYEIINTVEKSYSNNRICYHVLLKSKDIYSSLLDIVVKINTKLFESLKDEIETLDIDFITALYKITLKINNIFPDISPLEKLEFGKKQQIIEIVNNNRLFMNNLLQLLNNKIGGISNE